ncbi:ATP-grasp domain-containing protein [Oscillibacter sp.]|uniref:ATP-grasp domain-containing protein n=1 Tax=Oscillibacter sp. TaxID=1945593 RepID=UPI0028AE3FC8|nr:ATP-grasp domain-containing protein [Oscillibacter sp.]
MRGDFQYIDHLYQIIKDVPPLKSDYCIAFVYNSDSKIRDKIHSSECIYPEEQHMITSSFRKSAEYVCTFDGEEAFAAAIPSLKQKHKYILVYSMAQDVNGIGRRCIVPLLCDYYNLINIGAGFMECVYGGSKRLMYEKARHLPGVRFPDTYYLSSEEEIYSLPFEKLSDRWLLKPNDESASIGIEVFSPGEYAQERLCKKLLEYKKSYPVFCIQKYIEGDEVAVPLLWYKGQYYCPGVSQVVFQSRHHYLDYDTVAMGNCAYQEFISPLSDQLIETSISVAKALGYQAISRIDFRIQNNIGYIEDIGPNPTISQWNGANELFRLRLNAAGCCVYQLLLYSALEKHGLFKPSLDDTP